MVGFITIFCRHAFDYMQKAKHIGKILIQLPEEKEPEYPTFNGRSTYIITGGLGGIGMEVAKWMVDNGAKYLALVGRRPPNEGTKAEIEKLQENGVTVEVMLYDVGDMAQCSEMITRFDLIL